MDNDWNKEIFLTETASIRKIFKNRNSRNESEYNNHKKFFESVKQRSKKLYYSNLIIKYKNNLKGTWDVTKDSIGKTKSIKKFFPEKMIRNNKIVTDTDVIAKHFNTHFTEIRSNLSKKIETTAKTFEAYLRK